ncbi:MAG TPA: endo-1,4-beta-xylanase [Verrucomicrobiae bacterium]|nr:endo-1,4-beta-xylanase [Verrucomicrobiae bacterium]
MIRQGFLLVVLSVTLAALNVPGRDQWTPQQANAWYARQPWLAGCNFGPSTAINQLEMWQADSWDPATIDRELGLAEGLGFTSVRVFLHNLLWQQDSAGLLKRMDQFLSLAQKHHLGVMFVLFDSCWDPFPKLGPQRAPRLHVHNSGWVQSPGYDYLAHPERLDELKPYVQGVVGHFRDDARIHFWDVYNEPDNVNDPAYVREEPANKRDSARLLLEKTFAWAREMNPSQPLSSGVWLGNWGDEGKLSPMERVQLGQSDIITFHNYSKLEDVQQCVANLRRYHRPVICTEYMARPAGSTFDPILGWFKHERVGAYNWGFVAGKTQTIYPWDSWRKQYTGEPPVLFHDIYRPDGTPLVPGEVEYIRSVTGVGMKH